MEKFRCYGWFSFYVDDDLTCDVRSDLFIYIDRLGKTRSLMARMWVLSAYAARVVCAPLSALMMPRD